jgi:hypothetical protein
VIIVFPGLTLKAHVGVAILLIYWFDADHVHAENQFVLCFGVLQNKNNSRN